MSHAANPADATTPSKKHESRGTLGTYLELTKARLCALVLVTTAVGLWVAAPSPSPMLVVLTLLGTGFAAFGANALNQCLEERRDGLMQRTCERPLPSRRIPRLNAWAVSLALAVAGPVVLWIGVNPLAAVLALLTEILYLAVYTPLKPRTPLNTLVGAVVGALPPMIGWAAARGQLDLGAWLLALILFLWQIPHFLSLAWLYREDYARGGFRMLPSVDPHGRLTGNLVVLYALVLIPVSLALTITGLAGPWYAMAALVLGLGLLAAAVLFFWQKRDRDAKRAFLASVIYLPLLLGCLVADRRVPPPPASETSTWATQATTVNWTLERIDPQSASESTQ